MGSGPQNLTTTQFDRRDPLTESFASPTLGAYYNYNFPGGNMLQYPLPAQQLQGFTPAQIAGQNMQTGIASMGSPAADFANQNAAYTQRGDFLYPGSNPFLDATYNRGAQSLVNQYTYADAPRAQAAAALSGNLGGAAQQNQADVARFGLGNNLGNLASDIYGTNYQNERNRQLQQQGMLGQILGSEFIMPKALQDVGAEQQQFGQRALDLSYQNMVNQTNWPNQVYDRFANMINTIAGQSGIQIGNTPNPTYLGAGQQATQGLTSLLSALLGFV